LLGIFIAIVAIAIFIAVIAPGDAILSRGISDFFKMIIGVGAYIFPFALLIWAASFFIERGVAASTARLGIGLTIILLSVLAILGLTTPSAAQSPDGIFLQAHLMTHGGYVGGGIAWALLKLVGEGIAYVILIGLIVVGIVLIGFSITGLVERIQIWIQERMEARSEARQLSAYDVNGRANNRHSKRLQQDELMSATARLSNGIGKTAVLGDEYPQGGRAGQDRDYADSDFGYSQYEDVNWDPRDWDGKTWASEYGVPYDEDLGSTRRVYGDNNYGEAALEDDANLEAAHVQRGTTPKNTASSRQASGLTKKSQSSKTSQSKTTADEGADKTAVSDIPFELPDPAMLKASRSRLTSKAGENELRRTAAELQSTIEEFGIDAKVEGWVAGPTVTLFKLSLGEGVRLNRINSLADDIALALAAPAVRIFSPIPGTTLVGIEVPNANRSFVLLGDVLPDAPAGPLQLAVGKDVEGDSIVANLEKMPHLLIGGTTGSGKSVAINSMIMSVLMNATPAQVRMILIDPKMVELSLYNDIPHLYVPVVTDAQKAASALAWGVIEMERRLKLFQSVGVKNISQYNEYIRRQLAEIEKQRAAEAAKAEKAAAKAAEAAAKAAEVARDNAITEADEALKDFENQQGETESYNEEDASALSTKEDANNREQEELPVEMPLVLIVIDELADLMMVAGKEVETSISRLAQLARAAGLHLIIATQRPSTNVITGLIKANIVNRIAFNVASGIDSRVILDSPGAEDLIGNGDLLFSRPEYGKPQRIQGCFVSEPEIESVVDYLKTQAAPEYREDILSTAVAGLSITSLDSGGGDDDPLIWEAADIVVTTQFGSTSTLQRRLKVGYARAGRIMDMLEQKGIVGPPNGSKPREVLYDDVLDLESLKAIEQADSQDNSW
jgi:S-DNA-T family DNA segregation ATPase FtsK/SpoIIIE